MRRPDWPKRLNRIIAESQRKPFAWGEHDCCLFAADVVKELTGDDPAAPYRDKYHSEAGAARLLKKHDGARGMATAAFGPEIPPLMAQRGDVVLYAGPFGDALAVCIGLHCVAPGDSGLVTIPLSSAVTAWRIA